MPISPHVPTPDCSGPLSKIDLELLRDYQANASVTAIVEQLVALEKLLFAPEIVEDGEALDGLSILCDHLALQLAITPAKDSSERMLQHALLFGRSARYPLHLALGAMLAAARERQLTSQAARFSDPHQGDDEG